VAGPPDPDEDRGLSPLLKGICLNFSSSLFTLALTALLGQAARADVQPAPQHEPLLASPDARLAANKRLVYDFWREVLEGGHLELADRYLTESYIQHNPNVPTGRAGFVSFFSQFAKAHAIASKVQAPLVSITAEGDLVVLSFVARISDPAAPGASYTTTAFDMFRIENDKIAEHWDAERKRGVAELAATSPRPRTSSDARPVAPLGDYEGHYRVTRMEPASQGPVPADTMIDVIVQDAHLMVGFSGSKIQASPPEAFQAQTRDEFLKAASGDVKASFIRNSQGRVAQIRLVGGGLSFTGTR